MENQTKETDHTTEDPQSDNSDHEDQTENKENEDEEITFGDSDKLDNMITKKKVKKWKIIKVHVDKTGNPYIKYLRTIWKSIAQSNQAYTERFVTIRVMI